MTFFSSLYLFTKQIWLEWTHRKSWRSVLWESQEFFLSSQRVILHMQKAEATVKLTLLREWSLFWELNILYMLDTCLAAIYANSPSYPFGIPRPTFFQPLSFLSLAFPISHSFSNRPLSCLPLLFPLKYSYLYVSITTACLELPSDCFVTQKLRNFFQKRKRK